MRKPRAHNILTATQPVSIRARIWVQAVCFKAQPLSHSGSWLIPVFCHCCLQEKITEEAAIEELLPVVQSGTTSEIEVGLVQGFACCLVCPHAVHSLPPESNLFSSRLPESLYKFISATSFRAYSTKLPWLTFTLLWLILYSVFHSSDLEVTVSK